MIRRFLSDERGAAAIEMAFALPVTIMLMIGTLQFAMVLQASGAMRHGIGEGLRYAKVNFVADADDSTLVAAHKAQVEAVATSALAGVSSNGIKSLVFTNGTDANGAKFAQIDARYEMDLLIPFAAMPPITLNEGRKVYLPS